VEKAELGHPIYQFIQTHNTGLAWKLPSLLKSNTISNKLRNLTYLYVTVQLYKGLQKTGTLRESLVGQSFQGFIQTFTPCLLVEITAMKTNVGTLDRGIRLLLASVFFYLGLFLYSGSALGIGLVVAGGVLLATGLVGFCGLYSLLGLRTSQLHEQI
jgi:hypothetical protein